MRDPKFGYNWIWMLPVFLVMNGASRIKDFTLDTYRWLRLKYNLKKYPAIKELRQLSVQDKK
jgi:hypothetical protein